MVAGLGRISLLVVYGSHEAVENGRIIIHSEIQDSTGSAILRLSRILPSCGGNWSGMSLSSSFLDKPFILFH